MHLSPRATITLDGEDAAYLEPILRHYERFNQAHDGMYGDAELRVIAIRQLASTWTASALGNSEVPEDDTSHGESEDVLTTEDAAKVLDLTDRRVRQLINEGRLKGCKVRGSWLIDVASVAAMTQKGA